MDCTDNPPGASVTKYLIEVSKNGRAFTKLVEKSAKDAGCTGTDTDCEHTHSGLLEMQQRWYRISAYNHPNGKHAAAVVSTASNTVSHTTEDGAIPAAIATSGVRVGLNPAGRMTLYWDEPDTSAAGTPLPGAPIIGYYVYGGNSPAAATDVKKLHFVEANTSLVLTPNILSKFDAPDATQSWNFQVMAVNSVVRRGVADGVVTSPADGNWSPNVAVTAPNRAKNVTEDPDVEDNDLLNRPRFKKNVRVNNVNAGRTDIELEWEVEKVEDATDYRLERSEDRIDWAPVPVGNNNTDETVTDTGRIAGTTYWYRVFAEHRRVDSTANIWTEASTPVSVTTAPAGKPLAPRLDSVVSSSETQIDVVWTPPDDDYVNDPPAAGVAGSPAVGHGRIVSYEVDVSDNGSSWSLLATVAGKLDEEYTYDEKTKKVTVKKVDVTTAVEFFHKGLVQGQTKYYRVSTINNSRPNSKRSVPSDVDSDTTLLSLVSDSPGGLVAMAKDHSSIEIVWNARADDITAAPIIGYKIDYSMAPEGKCAEQWNTLVENTMSTTTAYTHMDLMPATGLCYRVFGINVVATSSGYVGYGDDYVTTNDNDAIATTDEAPPNAAPMAGAAIAGQTVMVDATVMVQSTITDADTDDTLTWSVMSDKPMYATATVDDMGMVTITGVAAGMATITVTATDEDGSGMSAMREIMVTVSDTPPATTAPMGAAHSVLGNSISVTWDPNSAQNTTLIKVALFNADVTALAGIDAPVKAFNLAAGDPGAHTFNNVPAGTYKVVVAAVDSEDDHVVSVVPDAVTIN